MIWYILNSHVGSTPDLDNKLWGTRDEDVREEGAPLDAVDHRVVRLVAPDVLAGVLGGAEVNHPLLRPHQIFQVIVWLERQAGSSILEKVDDVNDL